MGQPGAGCCKAMSVLHQLYKGDTEKCYTDKYKIRGVGRVIEQNGVELWGFRTRMSHLAACQIANIPVPIPDSALHNADTWFVWACTGPVSRIPALIPYPLPYIAFARDNGKVRAYRFDELVKRISR